MKEPDDRIELIIDQLAASTRSPRGRYKADESYKILRSRLFTGQYRIGAKQIISIAASIALLLTLTWSIYNYMTSVSILTISTMADIQTLTLPDNTEVTLNRYSSLTYPSKFKEKNREVSIIGEVYFEVAKDEKHPFIVQTGNIDVEVLGTHFNVEAYPQNAEIRTTLLEGRVAVRNKERDVEVILNPNESAIYHIANKELSKEVTTNAVNEIAWRKGEFVFEHQPLGEIVCQLSNAFNTTIIVDDAANATYKLTARFTNGETLHEILDLLLPAGGFTYTETNHIIHINKTKTFNYEAN